MKVYTRGGDQGETSLFGGQRVPKSDLRVQAYGDVDELNSVLGLVRNELKDEDLTGFIDEIQPRLFDLGGELATPDVDALQRKGQSIPRIEAEYAQEVEVWIDQLDAELEPLRNFVLPGGAPAASLLHLARTVCRRAERQVVGIAAQEPVSDAVLQYLNRLSDLFFVMARVVNHRAGIVEPTWVGRERSS